MLRSLVGSEMCIRDSVNAKDENSLTPLDQAIQRKKTETADLLRKHGGKTAEELKAEGK